jgi:WD40 repeat protein
VRIWDLETGACQLTLQTSETHAAALLPDGERLLTRGRSLDLWDLRTGVCLRKLRASYGRVMALHPDGRQAFCDDYRRIEGWDLETGRRMRLLEGHEASINALLCHPDGQRLISAGDDRTLRIWDLASATCLRILGGHAEPVRTLLLHPDGRRLLCATLDERLRIWDLATGECLGTWLQPGDKAYHRVLALHPDGQTLLLGRGGRVEIADLAALRSRDALGGTGRDVRAVAAHLDGVHVVSGDDGGALRLWRLDAAAGRAPRHLDRVSAVCLEPRGGVALTSGDETLHLWDLEGRPLRALSGHSGRVRDVLLSGDRAVSGGAEGTVRVWDLGSGACRHVLTGHAGGIERLALHPDRQHLASCDELTVRVWELASGACHHVLTGHTQRIFALAFHPHGRLLISAGYDGTARVWDLASGACVRTLELPEAHALLVQPDGRRLIASGPERTVNLVDLETGAAVHRLAGHAAPVQRLTLVNDGQHLLSLAHDQAIRLWDLATGEWLRSFAHPANVLCMAQAGPWLVSSCTDDAVRVWKIETGACVGLWPLRAAATSLTLSPAGRIVAGDLAGEVAFLQIEGR